MACGTQYVLCKRMMRVCYRCHSSAVFVCYRLSAVAQSLGQSGFCFGELREDQSLQSFLPAQFICQRFCPNTGQLKPVSNELPISHDRCVNDAGVSRPRPTRLPGFCSHTSPTGAVLRVRWCVCIISSRLSTPPAKQTAPAPGRRSDPASAGNHPLLCIFFNRLSHHDPNCCRAPSFANNRKATRYVRGLQQNHQFETTIASAMFSTGMHVLDAGMGPE